MNTIQEALRELSEQEIENKKSNFKHVRLKRLKEDSEVIMRKDPRKQRKQRVFDGLWDQVYCSLTDGGADSAYRALGDLNGRGLYDIYDITTSDIRPGFDTIVIKSSNSAPALKVAKIYGLETKVVPGKAIYVYVPEGAEVRTDLLQDRGSKDAVAAGVEEDFSKEIATIEEDFDSTLPVRPLPHDVVYDFIENVPVATPTRPPLFFPVGYIKELTKEIPAKFKGGRGSEGNPFVRIVKCSEMTVYTGADYENLQATKDMRKETGKERSGEKTGFSFEGETTVANKIGLSARGEEQLQCYIKRGTQPKAKYWISLNNEDLREATRQEVAEYLTPAHANTLLNGRGDSEESGAKIIRLKLANIYKIGRNGVSVM